MGTHGFLIGGAALALLFAAALFSRFSIDGTMSRDEAIYAYAGQQQAEGVPFYVSIFDQKTPLAPMIAGAAVATGRAVGADDLYAIRAAFFVFACLTVVAVYVLATALFGSPLAGLVSAAAFASFKGFALGSLTGPHAKQPAIFFAVLSMALVVRRQYFWAAFAGSLAFLVWQPLVGYPALAVALALLTGAAGERWRRFRRAAAGAIVPLAAVAVYFWLEGALGTMLADAFVFPVTYLERGEQSLFERLGRIASFVDSEYGVGKVVFWAGLGILLASLVERIFRHRLNLGHLVKRDPYVNVVIFSLIPITAFSLRDFQGYPDLYPLLPYAAIGLGAGFQAVSAHLDARARPGVGALLATAAVVSLVVVSWVSYSGPVFDEHGLIRQRAAVLEATRLLRDHETLYVLGSARPLFFTRRRNPSPYIVLTAGIDRWAVEHIRGGFEGWTREIRAADPAMVIRGGPWRSPVARTMTRWLRREYAEITVGGLNVFVTPAIRARAERQGLVAAS